MDHLWSTLDPSQLWDAYADWIGGYFTSSIPPRTGAVMLISAAIAALTLISAGLWGAGQKVGRNLAFRDGQLLATTPRRRVLMAVGGLSVGAAQVLNAVAVDSGSTLHLRVLYATYAALFLTLQLATAVIALWFAPTVRIGRDGVAFSSISKRFVSWLTIETDPEALQNAGLISVRTWRRPRGGPVVYALRLNVTVDTLFSAINYYRDRPDLRAPLAPVRPRADSSIGELYQIG